MSLLLTLFEWEDEQRKKKMKINHIAIWCIDLEEMKKFYVDLFKAKCNERYEDESVGFASYFLTLSDGFRIELMTMDSVVIPETDKYAQFIGWAHLAVSLGSEKRVDELTEKLVSEGHELLDGPYYTGDGYYESVILDPEGNRLELTV